MKPSRGLKLGNLKDELLEDIYFVEPAGFRDPLELRGAGGNDQYGATFLGRSEHRHRLFSLSLALFGRRRSQSNLL